jgi:two-component system, NarL family, response regulator
MPDDSNQPSIRVLLAEDNQLVRMGIAALVATTTDLRIAAEAADGIEALEFYRANPVDVVVADLKMPRFDGIQLLVALKKEWPKVRVLILTQYEGDESIHRALVAGALGYVTKETAGGQILNAIRAVASGKRHVPVAIATRLAEHALGPQLTPRETQVLGLLCKGMSNREIGAELSISERTVGVFVTAILGKLDVKSRTEAIAAAMRRGFVEPK